MTDSEFYRAPLGEDLRPLMAILWQEGIAHRVVEEGGEQVLQLADSSQQARARGLLQRWRSGELQVELRAAAKRPGGGIGPALRGAPVTAGLIAVSVAVFLLIYLGAPVDWVAKLSYAPFTLENGELEFAERRGEIWRVITPIFLHFGWLHITFNALWSWELGRRIEIVLGSFNLLGLVLVVAALSNTAQWQVAGAVLFGGLSGVVYGLLGFCWVAGTLNPRWRALVPATSIMLFMIGWLVFCIVGLVNVLGFAVANAAHVGGLLSGAALGVLLALANRRAR